MNETIEKLKKEIEVMKRFRIEDIHEVEKATNKYKELEKSVAKLQEQNKLLERVIEYFLDNRY